MVEHLLSGGIAASLVGSIFGLVKLITYLIQKNRDIALPNATNAMPHQQQDEIHAIFLWTVERKIQWEYLCNDIRGLKVSQDIINSRIAELVNSMSKVTDKLVDLIDRIDRDILSKDR